MILKLILLSPAQWSPYLWIRRIQARRSTLTPKEKQLKFQESVAQGFDMKATVMWKVLYKVVKCAIVPVLFTLRLLQFYLLSHATSLVVVLVAC